ncbi:hypothetical protein C0992_009525 [Termitomyces sp. T32_za158]|nr:hypothetical protein C0992_009525 [Termitomyces sp. T32_za158]
MDNMQILNKCKDSGVMHLANRRTWKLVLSTGAELSTSQHDDTDNVIFDADNEDMLAHLDSLERCHSKRNDSNHTNIDCVLQSAQDTGMFAPCSDCYVAQDTAADKQIEDERIEIVCADKNQRLETIWQAEYVQRRDKWKALNEPDQNVMLTANMQTAAPVRCMYEESNVPGISETATHCLTEREPVMHNIDGKDIIQRWSLNRE